MMLRVFGATAAAGILFAAGAIQRGPIAGRGGPPGIFNTTVPSHKLSVVQANPSENATTLSLLAPADLDVTVAAGGRTRAPIHLKAKEPFDVRLDGVKNGDLYEIRYDGGKLEGRLSLPGPRPGGFGFAIQADSHLDQNTSPRIYTQTLTLEHAAKPDFLIDLGDTFMNDKHPDYRDALPMYQAQHYYLGLVGVNAPVFLVLGNHDGEQGWIDRNRPGMDEWSSVQRKRHFPPVQTDDWATGDIRSANYYEFTWGDAQCIVLDPFHGTTTKPARTNDNWVWSLGEAQYRWLVRILKSSNPKYRFVFIHHLVGGAGRDSRGGAESSTLFEWGGRNPDGTAGFATRRPKWEAPLHDLFRKAGVNVVFHGHDHMYARQARDGVTYVLVPQPSYAGRPNTTSAEEYGYKAGNILPSPGYIRVEVTRTRTKVDYVKSDGSGLADSVEIKP